MRKITIIAAAIVIVAWYRPAAATMLSFSGYQWSVRSGYGGPGPNNWADQNVYVDSTGNLHLDLTYSNGQWYGAELVSSQAFGFGTYQFQLLGRPDQQDPNVVFGMFNYGPPTVGVDGTNEIDIEYGSFGAPATSPRGNWTVWPATNALAYKDTTQRFDSAGLNGDTSTQRFTWSSRQVAFQALNGHTDANSGEYTNWTYAPSDYQERIPQQAMPVHMNLWLFQGQPPTDGQNAEVVVSNFKFTPLTPVPLPGSGPLTLAGVGILSLLGRPRRRPCQGGHWARDLRSGNAKGPVFPQSGTGNHFPST